MEKKYRLKEVLKKYYTQTYLPEEATMEWWMYNTNFKSEALEEVPSRIELFGLVNKWNSNEQRNEVTFLLDNKFGLKEKDLCEKALNGELIELDGFNIHSFLGWYEKQSVYHYNHKVKGMISLILTILRAYQNEKKQ